MIRRLFLLLTLICAAGSISFAGVPISVDDLATRIDGSIKTVDAALAELAKIEQDESDFEAYEAELENLRDLWPSDLQVSEPPNIFDIDTSWVMSDLDKVDNEDTTDRSAVLLTGLRERFVGLRMAIDEKSKASAAGPTKDTDKQKLNEILKREEFQKPKAEEGLLARLWRELIEWLQSRTPNAPQQSERTGSPWLTTILWVVVIGGAAALIGFLLYRFAPSLFERFQNEGKSKRKDRVVLGEVIADDVAAADIFAEAEDLARRGELRHAIRKGYIAVLCELSDRKLIGLARHKTNRDYLRDVRSREMIHRDLGGLTQRFEQHWYGEKNVAGEDWTEFRELYRRTVSERA